MSGDNVDLTSTEVQPIDVKNRLSEKAPTNNADSHTRPTVATKTEECVSQAGRSDYSSLKKIDNRISRRSIHLESMITIRLLNSWGNGKTSGLSKLEFLDREGILVPVDASSISCRNCGLMAPKTLDRLVSPNSLDGNWGCILQFVPGEIEIDTRKFPNISAIRIHNLSIGHSIAAYNGIKAFTVILNRKEIYSGEFSASILEQSHNIGVSRPSILVSLIESSHRGSQRLDPPPYLQRIQEPRTQKVFSKTHNFSSNNNFTSDNQPSDKQRESPRQAETYNPSKAQTKDNFKIITNYNLSDEEFVKVEDKTSVVKTDDKDRGSSSEIRGKNFSIDSNELQKASEKGRVENYQIERSSSKASRSSQDSKIRNHPRIAPSASKLMFESSKQGSHSRPKVNPITPGRTLTLDDKIAPISVDWNRNNQESSADHLKPLRPDRNRLPVSRLNGEFARGMWDKLLEDNPDFTLPNLPHGKVLTIRLYSNWGDNDHIGLKRIELFDIEGRPIVFDSPADRIEWVTAPGQTKAIYHDPEFLQHILITQPNLPPSETQWMTAISEGNPLQIRVRLPSKTSLSLVRIWNYSKSRTHASRGVRHMSLHLEDRNDRLIFMGEIARSSGDSTLLLEEAEYLVFTANKAILLNIENGDWIDKVAIPESSPERGKSNDRTSIRPPTGDKEGSSPRIKERQNTAAISGLSGGSGISGNMLDLNLFAIPPPIHSNSIQEQQRRSGPRGLYTMSVMDYSLKSQYQTSCNDIGKATMMKRSTSDSIVYSETELIGDTIEFKFLTNWGAANSVFGIRAIEIYGKEKF